MEEELIKENIVERPGEAIAELVKFQKDRKEINNHKKEYYDLDRTLRETQIGKIQQDKVIKKEDGSKLVRAVRTPVNYQKKIVNTSVAFEFGNPVDISATESNELTDSVLDKWESMRIDSNLQELKKVSKSETESCLVFYITGIAENRKIRSKVYSSQDGTMSPYFNDDHDMVFFTWSFSKKEDEKEISYFWVYDEQYIHKLKQTDNGIVFQDSIEHGFDKIPIVYDCQKKVEYEDVKILIDRYEVCLSRLGEANDYTGHPIMMINGEVAGLPDKNDSGKVLYSPKKIDPNSQKEITGDAKFLTYDNAPESVKLELEQLKDFIAYITSTPELSLNALKSLGNVATETLQLMFLDPVLKAKLNEGRNRTIVQRCLKIIESGIGITLDTRLNNLRGISKYDIEFNSILPNSLTELMGVLTSGIGAGIISKETAVKRLSLTNDNELELSKIQSDNNNNLDQD